MSVVHEAGIKGEEKMSEGVRVRVTLKLQSITFSIKQIRNLLVQWTG